MSNPNPAHKPAGTPDGGQFATTSQTEAIGVQELDGTDKQPTDPRELIAYQDAQLETDHEAISDLWNTACGSGDFDEYEAAKEGLAARDYERYRALAHAVVTAPAPTPVVVTELVGPEDALRDRRALDDIACALGESDDWNSDTTGMIADLVRGSGRPDPGEDALTAEEFEALDESGEDTTEAAAKAYRAKLAASHAAAAAAKLDSSELGTEGLDEEINATFQQMWDVRKRVQTLMTRKMARELLTAVPDAAYLDMMQHDEDRGHMRAVSVCNAAGDVIIEDTGEWECEQPDRPDLSYLASQLTDDLSPDCAWTQFSVDVPQDDPFDETFRLDLRAASKAGE